MSKPEFIIQDFGGIHNSDIEGTSARLIQGGSWKKQRVIVILPAASMIPAKVMLSHLNLIYPPNNGVLRILALGMEVGDAYSTAIDNVLAHPELREWEFVLTMEHDNTPPPDGLLKLIEIMETHPEYSAVGGLYFTKGEGGIAQIWGDPADPVTNFRPRIPVADQLIECCGTGMGFTLYRLSMFRDGKIPRPFFKTKADASGVGTQDLMFWAEARKYGYRCAVDCRVRVGHHDVATDITW
jgi:hypothetical protein